MNKRKLYNSIMESVAKQVKYALNEDIEELNDDEIIDDRETITEEDGDIDLTLSLYKNGDKFEIWIQDHMGGSGIQASGRTPLEAGEDAAGYIANYFYKNDEDYDEDYDEEN